MALSAIARSMDLALTYWLARVGFCSANARSISLKSFGPGNPGKLRMAGVFAQGSLSRVIVSIPRHRLDEGRIVTRLIEHHRPHHDEGVEAFRSGEQPVEAARTIEISRRTVQGADDRLSCENAKAVHRYHFTEGIGARAQPLTPSAVTGQGEGGRLRDLKAHAPAHAAAGADVRHRNVRLTL